MKKSLSIGTVRMTGDWQEPSEEATRNQQPVAIKIGFFGSRKKGVKTKSPLFVRGALGRSHDEKKSDAHQVRNGRGVYDISCKRGYVPDLRA